VKAKVLKTCVSACYPFWWIVPTGSNRSDDAMLLLIYSVTFFPTRRLKNTALNMYKWIKKAVITMKFRFDNTGCFFFARPISSCPTHSPTHCQRCAVRRTSGRFNSQWQEVGKTIAATTVWQGNRNSLQRRACACQSSRKKKPLCTFWIEWERIRK